MIKAIEIESTETCPFRYYHGVFCKHLCSINPNKLILSGRDPSKPLDVDLPCLGLECDACPCNKVRCETCGQTKHCFVYCHLREELSDVPEMVCSNWQPIKESK